MKLILTLIFIALTIGNVARIRVEGVGVTLLDASVLFLFICWLTTDSFKILIIKKNYLTKPLLIFITICILSLLINLWQFDAKQIFISSLYLFRWVIYASVFFIVVSQTKDLKIYIKKLMYISGIILVIAGYVQYFFIQDLRVLYNYGWDDHLYRLVGAFLDPNFTGVFYVLFLLFILSTILQKDTYKVPPKIGEIIILFLTLGAIILTYSRTSYLALIIGVVAIFNLYKYKKLLFGSLVLIIVLILFFANPKNENTNLFRVFSSVGRIETAKNALLIIEKNPLLGVGFNAYRYAQNKYKLRETPLWSTSNADAGADTSLLFVLATTGIVGLLSYLYIWKKLLYQAFKLKRKDYLFISSTLALFTSSLFINSLFYTYLMLWMWVLAGLMEQNEP